MNNKSGMLIKHLRRLDGSPFATIVAIGPNKVGISICNKKDRFCKKTGLELALKSAHSGKMPEIPNKKIEMWSPKTHYQSNMKFVIPEAIDMMKSRSLKYFKPKNNNSTVTTESISQTNRDIVWREFRDGGNNSLWLGYGPSEVLYFGLKQKLSNNKVVWYSEYLNKNIDLIPTIEHPSLEEAKLLCQSYSYMYKQ